MSPEEFKYKAAVEETATLISQYVERVAEMRLEHLAESQRLRERITELEDVIRAQAAPEGGQDGDHAADVHDQ